MVTLDVTNPSKLMPVTRLTIRIMKVVIEPTDVFGIVYAILQVRRCVPLKNESEDECE